MSEVPTPAPEEEAEEHLDSDPPTADAAPGAGANAIDVAALAERVYQLMRAEVRLEQARLGYSASIGRRKR
jgi:hypothetical protein